MAGVITTSTYGLTAGDHARYVLRAYFRSFIRWPTGLVNWSCALGTVLFFSGFGYLRGDISGALRGTAIAAAVWLLLIPLLYMVAAWNIARKTANTTAPRSVTFAEDEVHILGQVFDVHYAWPLFARVEQDRKHLFLVPRTGGAYIVPKAAFVSSQEADQAYTQAQSHIAGARDRQIGAFANPLPPAQPPATGFRSPPFKMTFWLFAQLYPRQMAARAGVPLTAAAIFGFVVSLWFQARDRGWTMDTFVHTARAYWPTLVFFAFVPFLAMPLSWLSARRLPSAKGERCLILTPDQVQASGENYDVRLAWNNVRKITMTSRLILFTVPAGLIALPVNAFAARSEARAFHDQAVAYWQAAK